MLKTHRSVVMWDQVLRKWDRQLANSRRGKNGILGTGILSLTNTPKCLLGVLVSLPRWSSRCSGRRRWCMFSVTSAILYGEVLGMSHKTWIPLGVLWGKGLSSCHWCIHMQKLKGCSWIVETVQPLTNVSRTEQRTLIRKVLDALLNLWGKTRWLQPWKLLYSEGGGHGSSGRVSHNLDLPEKAFWQLICSHPPLL